MLKTAENAKKTLYKEFDFGLVIFKDFPKGLTHEFESNLKNCLFHYIFFKNRVRKDD